jgi:SAM-dependent methyltransferase
MPGRRVDARRLYDELAWTWPIISPPEHYVEEATFFAETIRKYSVRKPKTLLDLGCGGGHNDMTLKRHFKVTGVDVSEKMLALARMLNPEVEYVLGDMRGARLGRRFDAVVIFDSIDYMQTRSDLLAAFRTVRAHLKPGGIFVTYLEATKERFSQNRTTITRGSRGDVDVTLVENVYDPDTRDTTYEATFVYFIRKAGRLRVELDRHVLGVFRLREVRDILVKAGFDVKVLEFKLPGEEGLPMLVGVNLR